MGDLLYNTLIRLEWIRESLREGGREEGRRGRGGREGEKEM